MSNERGPMTESMFYVLLSLLYPSHGYQMMQEIEKISLARVRMGPGTLYGLLSRLEDDGLIVIENMEGRKKVYQITAKGREHLAMEYQRLKDMISDGKIIEGETADEA